MIDLVRNLITSRRPMSEWVEVNGERVERTFLEDNIAEALAYDWCASQWMDAKDHGHCLICVATISGRDSCYVSEGGWCCQSCYQAFLGRGRGRPRR